jgi:hypothetical protein
MSYQPTQQGAYQPVQYGAELRGVGIKVTVPPVFENEHGRHRPLENRCPKSASLTLSLVPGFQFGERIDPRTGGLLVYVKRLVQGGPAASSGRVNPGDTLVLINGLSSTQTLNPRHARPHQRSLLNCP